jgi:serine-type D-Ala-D-Ala carboxypeptidase (penicillin-binding protein 5/6)
MTPSARLYTPPVFASKEPKISTDSYCVLDRDNGSIVVGKSMKSVRELASITKTMTLFTTLNLLVKYKIDIDSKIIVTEKSASISGNSAHLKCGDVLTIRDICYALSLPSGNDAGYLLAWFFGKTIKNKGVFDQDKTKRKLLKEKKKAEKQKKPKKKDKEQSLIDKVKSTQYFYNEMNKIARDIGMQYTTYQSPHGLNNKQNVSCVYDVSLLMTQASKNPLFITIMGEKTYTAKAQEGSPLRGDK